MEGLLPPSRSSDVRRHLDECPLCADVHDSLEEIRGLLGRLPGPSPMPADVAGRIDAALAAEALLSATAPAHNTPADFPKALMSADPVPVEASHSQLDTVGGTRVSRETTSAADRPAGHPRAATGPGRNERRLRTRRRTAVLGTVLTVATLGLGTVFVQSMGDEDVEGPKAARSQDASAKTFSGDTIENQVTKLLAENGDVGSLGTEAKPNTPGSPTDGASTFRTVNVPDCIREGIGRSEPALGARQGRYQDTQAYLVVLTDASHADRVMAYVVDADCIDKQRMIPGEVLAQQSYARSAAAPSAAP
ncbi:MULTISPECIES: anti-sigma factor family protein [Streptomyces]|uniref:anti-sigma factor family protein n=1 Tax=Streptomyces TaxID=1883 RepID=UPI0027E562CF|nr:hypothetical protein [Streptomyces ruber]